MEWKGSYHAFDVNITVQRWKCKNDIVKSSNMLVGCSL